jgi:hypothetical protein
MSSLLLASSFDDAAWEMLRSVLFLSLSLLLLPFSHHHLPSDVLLCLSASVSCSFPSLSDGVIEEILNHCSESGDIQTCVTLCLVLGPRLLPKANTEENDHTPHHHNNSNSSTLVELERKTDSKHNSSNSNEEKIGQPVIISADQYRRWFFSYIGSFSCSLSLLPSFSSFVISFLSSC